MRSEIASRSCSATAARCGHRCGTDGPEAWVLGVRRSGVVEAVAGDAGPIGLAAKLANSIGRSNTLHKTYAPVDIEAVRNTDAARLRGRQRMRAENESGAKVSKKQPKRVSNFKPHGAK